MVLNSHFLPISLISFYAPNVKISNQHMMYRMAGLTDQQNLSGSCLIQSLRITRRRQKFGHFAKTKSFHILAWNHFHMLKLHTLVGLVDAHMNVFLWDIKLCCCRKIAETLKMADHGHFCQGVVHIQSICIAQQMHHNSFNIQVICSTFCQCTLYILITSR